MTAKYYEGWAEAWAAGPGPIYHRLSSLVVAGVEADLRGQLVLDLGAGTGETSAAVAAAGGSPVALDLALDMLRQAKAGRPPAIAGDLMALPFGAGSFGAAVAGFSLSHLAEPERAMAEVGRVVRPGGRVLSAVFAAEPRHPFKVAVEQVLTDEGWARPAWVEQLKDKTERILGDPDQACAAAMAAGWREVSFHVARLHLGFCSPEQLAAWRLGMPQVASWLGSWPVARRQSIRQRVVAAAGAAGAPTLRVAVLSARAG